MSPGGPRAHGQSPGLPEGRPWVFSAGPAGSGGGDGGPDGAGHGPLRTLAEGEGRAGGGRAAAGRRGVSDGPLLLSPGSYLGQHRGRGAKRQGLVHTACVRPRISFTWHGGALLSLFLQLFPAAKGSVCQSDHDTHKIHCPMKLPL